MNITEGRQKFLCFAKTILGKQYRPKHEIGCKQGLQYTPHNVQLFEYS